MTQMRKDFEAWLKPLLGGYFDSCDYSLAKSPDGRYESSRTYVLWMAFSAGYDAAP